MRGYEKNAREEGLQDNPLIRSTRFRNGFRQVYPEENFTKLIELHKTKGPVPFRPTQRDYKRQEKLMSVDSLSEITFDDRLFKDEADLNGFVRWILRCQAKREAGVFKP